MLALIARSAPFLIAFVTGGCGAVAEQHLMDPSLALAIGVVINGVIGRIALKHVPAAAAK